MGGSIPDFPTLYCVVSGNKESRLLSVTNKFSNTDVNVILATSKIDEAYAMCMAVKPQFPNAKVIKGEFLLDEIL